LSLQRYGGGGRGTGWMWCALPAQWLRDESPARQRLYQDYVIRAFNEDNDRFVVDRSAQRPTPGTDLPRAGFLVGGPWDQVKVPIRYSPAAGRMNYDMVGTTGSTFQATDLARCHTHKFD